MIDPEVNPTTARDGDRNAPGKLRRQLLGAAFVTAASGLAVWLALGVVFDPSIWPAAERRPQQCEALLASSLVDGDPRISPAALARTIREPQNSWSCLAYFFIAALIAQRARSGLARWLAAAAAALGLGALLYHASGSRELRHFDMAALYWVYGVVVLIAAARAFARGAPAAHAERRPALAALGVAALAILATAFRNVRLGDIKPLHVSVATGLTAASAAACLFLLCVRRRERRSWTLLLAGLAALGVGLVLQVGDRPGNWCCHPGALVQAHALWHILSAACLALTAELLESGQS